MTGSGGPSGGIDDLAVMASGLAHELRHPLNAVRFTLASLMARVEKMEPAALREEALEIVREIKDDMTRLEEIIDSFLRFARPEARKPERVDLRAVARDTARFLRADLTNRGMTVRVEAPESPVPVLAPEINLRHVMMNLALNAAEASERGGEILLRVARRGGRAVAEVEDRGAGVPEADVPRIFDPFFSTKEGGAGLGLAICRRLVSDAGGTLDYRPAEPKGAVFAVELPLAGEPGATDEEPH